MVSAGSGDRQRETVNLGANPRGFPSKKLEGIAFLLKMNLSAIAFLVA
jgi:hypothetical protein